MGRFRDKFSRLSTKWPASRSTSPTPGVITQPPESTTDPLPAGSTRDREPHASERLWNKAYDDLKTTQSTITEAYEKILSDQLQASESSGLNIIALDHATRWCQMEQLVSSGLQSITKDVERKEKVNQWLEMSKPVREAVGMGLKAVPQAAVPWAGICCALEILSSPLTEPKKNRDGMEYVLKRMDWYWRLSPWLLQDDLSSGSGSQPLRDQLERNIVQLFQKLLLFQMKSVILYNRSRVAVFIRDLPKVDDWATHVEEIKDLEAALGVDSSQYNTLEMRANLQEISITTKEHAKWQRKERLDEKDNECLRELRITNPSKDKESIIYSKGGLLYESYRWVVENSEYQQWLNENDNNLLWIKGDPGKGKTMLLAGIIEQLEKLAPGSVFYFFCQATEPRLRTATNVLRGLIWFLVQTRPRLISHVRHEYDREGKGVFDDSNAWHTLTGILSSILENEESRDCVFVIDALDECTTDRDQLVRLISRVSTSYKPKWIVSSRNLPEIECRLDSLDKKVLLQLELNHAAISDAVKNYIVRKVDQLDKDNGYSDATREEVQSYLMAKADNTFLWVSLVCEELGQPDVMSHHTLEVLKSFPAGLGKLYERMIEKLIQSRDREFCKAVLGIIGVAYRPLSLAELSVSDSKLNQFVEKTETLSNIVRSCGSFLAIRDGTVYTVHQSVKDFLRTSHEVMGSGVAQRHCDVFFSSIKMLHGGLHRDLFSLGDSGTLIDDIKTPKSHALFLFEYACLHWVDHFCDGQSQELQGQNGSYFSSLVTFFRESYLYWLEAMSLLRFSSEAVMAIVKLKNHHQDAPQELRDLVNDAWRFVLTHRSIMDTAPLQLYDSALIFSPKNSIIRQCFEKEIANSIVVDAPTFHNWDACLQTIPGSRYDIGYVSPRMEFSPDGNLILVSRYGNVLILDASTGGRVARLNIVAHFAAATWHPSGQQVAVLDNYEVFVYDLSRGEPTLSCEIQGIYSCNAHVSFSPDGQLLAYAEKDIAISLLPSNIHIWDTLNKRIQRTIVGEGKVQYLDWVSYPSASLCLLLISRDENGIHIDLWDINTECFGRRISSLSLTGETYKGAAINHDWTRLALSTDKGVKTFCWSQGLVMKGVIRESQSTFDRVSGLTWTDDDEWIIFSLVEGPDEGLVVWDEHRDARIAHQNISAPKSVYCGKGNRIATTDGDVVRFWDLGIILGNSINHVLSDATTKKLVSSVVSSLVEPIAVYYTNDDDVEIFNRVSGEKLIESRKTTAKFGYDGRLALISDDNGSVEFWQFDPSSGRYHLPSRFTLEIGVIIAFGPPRQVALCDSQGLRICDSSTCEVLSILPTTYGCIRSEHERTLISFARNGYLAIAYYDTNDGEKSRLVIWDSGSMEKMQDVSLTAEFNGELSYMIDMSLSESGLVAIATPISIWLVKVNQGTWVRRCGLPHYASLYLFMDLSPDSQLATDFGVLDRNLELMDMSGDDRTCFLEDHWDPNKWSMYRIGSDEWLMKSSRRILRIPGHSVRTDSFSLQTDSKSGMATVIMIHDNCLFRIHVNLKSAEDDNC